MNRDDRSRRCEPWDWYKHLEACRPSGAAQLRYGGWDQTHATCQRLSFDAEQRTNEFKSPWRRLISTFRQILSCWHREDDESLERQSAKGQSGMTGKNGSKGKALNKKVSKGRSFGSVLARSNAPMARASRAPWERVSRASAKSAKLRRLAASW